MNENETAIQRVNLTELREVSRLFAESGYFPDAKSMAQAFVKIATGKEIGISPMASMTGIAVIQGKPVVGANIIAAKVKMSGYNYRITKLDNTGCVIDFFDRAGENIGTSSFDEKDARDAGLLGKDNWKKYARNMYFARAISNGQRWYCPDATQGQLVYTPDELGAKVDIDGNVITDKQGNAVVEAEFSVQEAPTQPQTKRAPAPVESQDEIQAQRIREIDQWLLEMAGGVETDYKALLKRVTVYEKDGAEHYIRKIEEFQNKVRWTNKAHHVTKDLYDAWRNTQAAKRNPAESMPERMLPDEIPIYNQNPEDGLPF